MTPSSFPKEPVRVRHLECGAQWEMYVIEWPPKIVICTHCKVGLKLVGHDSVTKFTAYRQI